MHNQQAEREVLASILLNNDNILDIMEVVQAKDFYSEKNQNLFNAMECIYKQDKPIDITTITDFFKNDLSSIGGFSYLADVTRSGVTFNIEHAKIVKAKSDMRKLQFMLQGVLNNLEDKDLAKTVTELQTSILSFGFKEDNQYVTDSQMMVKTLETIEKHYNNKSEILGLRCGISTIDTVIGGFQRQMVYTIAGRPSMGKSAFVNNIAENFSKHYRGLLYSMEMNEFQIGTRRIAMNSFIDGTKIRTGKLQEDEWLKIAQAGNKISNGKLLTNCNSSVHVNEIYSQGKKMKLQGGLDFIMLDHLGLMNTEGMGPDIRQQTTNIMRRCKTIAKELDCVVIVLSQLSRGVEQRADKRPMLSDLKESAGVEENSDVVMLLYRDEYYNKDTDKKNIIEANVGKQRDGRTGTVELAWLPQYQLIRDFYKG